MRFYGFDAAELTTEARPSLSLTEDPKTTWAQEHPEYFPVDVNQAPREALLRVPGIGYKNVERILKIRRYHSLRLDDLKKLNVRVKSVLRYLVTVDHLPTLAPISETAAEPAQMDLFASFSALTGVI